MIYIDKSHQLHILRQTNLYTLHPYVSRLTTEYEQPGRGGANGVRGQ